MGVSRNRPCKALVPCLRDRYEPPRLGAGQRLSLGRAAKTRMVLLTAAALGVMPTGIVSFHASLRAEDARGTASISACTLLTNADIEKVTGRKMFTEATLMLGGALCGFDVAQLIVFLGEDAEQRWENMLKSFGHQNEKRFPVPELSDTAYAFYPKPKTEFEDTNAFVVVKADRQVVVLSVASEARQPAQAMQPQAIELTKIVLNKLRTGRPSG